MRTILGPRRARAVVAVGHGGLPWFVTRRSVGCAACPWCSGSRAASSRLSAGRQSGRHAASRPGGLATWALRRVMACSRRAGAACSRRAGAACRSAAASSSAAARCSHAAVPRLGVDRIPAAGIRAGGIHVGPRSTSRRSGCARRAPAHLRLAGAGLVERGAGVGTVDGMAHPGTRPRARSPSLPRPVAARFFLEARCLCLGLARGMAAVGVAGMVRPCRTA